MQFARLQRHGKQPCSWSVELPSKGLADWLTRLFQFEACITCVIGPCAQLCVPLNAGLVRKQIPLS